MKDHVFPLDEEIHPAFGIPKDMDERLNLFALQGPVAPAVPMEDARIFKLVKIIGGSILVQELIVADKDRNDLKIPEDLISIDGGSIVMRVVDELADILLVYFS